MNATMTETRLDEELIPRIKALIDEYGKDLVFSVRAAIGDPTTGAVSGSTATYTVRCTPPGDVNIRYVDGTIIKRGDLQVVVPAQGLPFEPAAGQVVTFDGRAAHIVHVSPIYTGFMVACWRIHLRR